MMKAEMTLYGTSASSDPSPSPQTPPPFAFSHPLVYAFRVQDRVQALDRFIRCEIGPKVLRLRKEHDCVEHQLQRLMTKKHDFAGISTATTSKQKQAQRLKHQAWLWKRTSKGIELNRLEPLFELATELQTISKELNPNILRLTMLWQRSQSIAPLKYVAADDSFDVVYDDEGMIENGDRRRYLERQRLLREYQNVCKENIRVSKSIQKRIDKLATIEVETLNSMENVSFLSSLMIFSNNHCVCNTCQAIFHKDYLNALVVRVPNKCEGNFHTSDNTSTYICIHCWSSREREQRNERDREIQCSQPPRTKILPPTSKNKNDEKHNEIELQTSTTTKSQSKKNPPFKRARWKARKKAFKDRMIAAATSSNGESSCDCTTDDITARETINNPLFEGVRWNARKKVIKNRLRAAARSSNGESSFDCNTDTTDALTAHEIINDLEHYIASMSSLDDGLSKLGETLPSYRNRILEESDHEESCSRQPSAKSTRIKSIATMKLKMNSSAILDSNNDAKSKTDASKWKNSWSRFGSSESSICSNSIVESDPQAIQNFRRAMDDRFLLGKDPIKRGDIWNQNASPDSSMCSSIFSDSSVGTSRHSCLSASSSELVGPNCIKSAMKKTSACSSSSKSGASPTKVDGFPFEVSNKKKSVRFRSPLEDFQEYKDYITTMDNSLLNTSAEIMDQIEYFCKWDSFINPFEQKV